MNKLREDPTINVDGRNNIYTLCSANFWDDELCRRALGYGPDEVIARLEGKVPKVQPLMDGVYVVFNDNAKQTYDEFLSLNETFKPLLGLA